MAETFAFGELSAVAKARALDAHREQLDYTWWCDVYEDARRIGTALGISLNLRKDGADINFAGFSSQGDGCCWSGILNITDFEHAVAKIAEDAPNDQDLAALAVQAVDLYNRIVTVHVANKLNPPCPEGDDDMFADCYPTVKISVVGDSHRGFSTVVKSGHYDIPLELEDDLDQFCQDFADWIYSQLEQEHDYITSDESTECHINDNEMMFYEDGSDV